ncbi:MAG: hypothetical protein HYW49_10365 [Deltaproteobacteria bacterium]|nr:hypothetical protein [Deltaproteobacteria bacterium]
MKKKSFFLLALSVSSMAQAQYSGTVGDLNAVWNPPGNIQGTICQSQTNTGNEHSYKACSDGVASARYMAEKYATAAGKYMGCIDGWYQGIWDGFYMAKNPTAEMLKAAQDYIQNATLNSALTRASEKAKAEAKTESADQIVGRYRQVVGVKDSAGNQVLPDKSYKWPTVTFMGFEDGYEYDLQHGNTSTPVDFTGPTNAGWINAQTKFEYRIAAAKIYGMSPQYTVNMCDVQQTIFGRHSMPQLTIWDYFKAERDYQYQTYGWKNGDWTWDYFVNEENNLDLYQNYKGIANLEKNITVKVPIVQKQEQIKRDANGNPIPKRDANGNPIIVNGQPVYETVMVDVVVGYKDELRRVPLDANDVKALQAVYRKGFVDSYNVYYARQYASLKYHEEGFAKYGTSKLVGQLIGEEVARQTAQRTAYNSVYKANSASKFAEQIKHLYKLSFDRLIAIFAANPVVDLNDAQILGATDDDIFRAGEELKAYYDLTNLGEVSRPITLSLANSSDVLASAGGFILAPGMLERVKGQTPVLGQITTNRYARDRISTNFMVNNPSDLAEIKSSLTTAKGASLVLGDYAEIGRVDASVDPISGNLAVQVQLVNPSNVEAPAFPSVQMTLDGAGGVTVEKTVEKVPPKGTLPVGLSTNQLDPIQLITSRSVSGDVQVKLAGRVVQKSRFTATVNAAPDALLATYFHALVTGKASNTGGQNIGDRIASVIGMIDERVNSALANGIIKWRRQSDVDRTIVSDLQTAYGNGKAAGEVSDQVDRYYTQLALMLAKKVNNRGPTRIRGLDKHYLRALQRFAPAISTKWRHYK